MKTDLEILIEHLQTEVDYLKSALDQCVIEWDFEGAKAYREPLIYTKRKLTVLKCLENPNYNKISHLTSMISRMEMSLNERKFERNNLDEQTRQNMENIFYESTINRIKKSKTELKELKSIVCKQRIDNDKILELLEGLDLNKNSEIEFEIFKDKIYLLLNIKNNQANFSFRTSEKTEINHHLVRATKSILYKLGFNVETLTKQIPNFNEVNKITILEELAIVYFEVFNIFDKEIKITKK